MILKEIALHHLQTQYVKFQKYLERVQAADEHRPEMLTGYARKFLGPVQATDNLVSQLVNAHLEALQRKQPVVGQQPAAGAM